MSDYISNYTGEQIDNILNEAIELPDHLPIGDLGKVLTVGSEELEWQYPIDTVGAHNGEILKYSDNSGLVWVSPLTTLPDYSNANEGSCLKYTGSTTLVWGDPIDTSDANNGNYLKYSSNSGLIWEDPIDTSDANDGDYLKYSSNSGLIWDTPNFIDTSNANDGDCLKYSSNSGLIWGAPAAIDISNASIGSLLTYNSDGIAWTNGDGEEGQILQLVPGGSGMDPTWVDNPIPELSSDDQGKILAVSDNGKLELMSISEAQSVYDNYNNS